MKNQNDRPLTGHTDKNGTQIRLHDKLLIIEGRNQWFTHVMKSQDGKKWHREADYSIGVIVGYYPE